jgi:hypothetical protein
MSDEERDTSDNVADTHVEKDDDGNYTATVTKEDGSTSEGSSTGGLLSEPSAADAIEDAK